MKGLRLGRFLEHCTALLLDASASAGLGFMEEDKVIAYKISLKNEKTLEVRFLVKTDGYPSIWTRPSRLKLSGSAARRFVESDQK